MLRYRPGGFPNSRLHARLKAASDSYPLSAAISTTPRDVFSSDLADRTWMYAQVDRTIGESAATEIAALCQKCLNVIQRHARGKLAGRSHRAPQERPTGIRHQPCDFAPVWGDHETKVRRTCAGPERFGARAVAVDGECAGCRR